MKKYFENYMLNYLKNNFQNMLSCTLCLHVIIFSFYLTIIFYVLKRFKK